MMWGEKGFWDMLTPEIPGGAYPIKMPMWTTYNISFSLKSKILKDFLLDIKILSWIKHFLLKEISVFGNRKMLFLKEFLITTPKGKFAWIDKTFNIFSLIKKNYNLDMNINLNPTNKNLKIINILRNLDYLNLANYVD